MPESGKYKTQSIDTELMERVEITLHKAGYKSKSEFLHDSIRRNLDRCQEIVEITVEDFLKLLSHNSQRMFFEIQEHYNIKDIHSVCELMVNDSHTIMLARRDLMAIVGQQDSDKT